MENIKNPVKMNNNIPKKKRNYIYKEKTRKRIQQSTADAESLASTLRLVKNLIKEHFHKSKNRSKVIDTLQHLIDCFDKQWQRQQVSQLTPINQASSSINNQEESDIWVFFDLEEYLLNKELNNDFLNDYLFEDINHAQTSKQMG